MVSAERDKRPEDLARALEEEKAHLENLFEGIQEAIVLVDNEGMISRANREFENLFGYGEKEILGRNIDELVAPGELKDEAREITRSVLSGGKTLVETRRRHRDGNLIDVSVLAAPVSVKDSQIGHYGIYRDISERKRAEALLRHEKAHLEHLFESLQEAIVLVDNEGIIRKANREFENLFGYPSEEAVGRNIDDLIAPDDFNAEAREITRLVVSGKKQLTETKRRRKDGTLVDVSVLASPISVDGSREGYYGIYRDISDRKRALEKLARSRWRIEQLHITARELDSCSSEDQSFRITLEAACSILDLPLSSISMVRKDRLQPVAFSDPGLEQALKNHRFVPGRDLPGRAYMERRTIRADSRGEKGLALETGDRDYSLLVASPVGQYGVFTAFYCDERIFDDEQASLLELLLSYTSEAVKRIRLLMELRDQAIHDPLTGLFNRNYFDQVIQQEMERASRYQHSIGIVMIDIDRFKEVNDRFGHQKGDEVLKAVAGVLNGALRKSDTIIRYCGDEFLVVLPETEGDTSLVIRRLRRVVSEITVGTGSDSFQLTLSIGAVLWRPGDGVSIDSVLSEADSLMYGDKQDNG